MNIRIKQKIQRRMTDGQMVEVAEQSNECPKEEDGNCLVSGVFHDSDPIGGG